MNKININELDYPLNLIYSITHDEELIKNANSISDLNASVEYILNTLSVYERMILVLKYKDNMTSKEIKNKLHFLYVDINYIERKIILRLAQSDICIYLYKGVKSLTIDSINEKNKRIKQLENAITNIYNLCKEKIDMNNLKEITNTVIDTGLSERVDKLNLSNRILNCLLHNGINTIEELANLSYEDLEQIKNLGHKSIHEIETKLEDYGYHICWNK